MSLSTTKRILILYYLYKAKNQMNTHSLFLISKSTTVSSNYYY